MKNPFVIWKSGIGNERDFWDGWLAQRGGQWPEAFQFAMDPQGALRTNIVDALSQTGGRVERLFRGRRKFRVLDVGAGPLTPVGRVMPGVDVEVVAVDPLAPIYDALLARHGIHPHVRTQFAPAEELSAFFEASSFDAVHVSNALDHSLDPMRGIEEMLRVVKCGRSVLLSHSRNEAEHESYSGFHQWNFDLDQGDSRFVIWNRDERIDVAQALPVRCDVTNRVQPGSSYIHTVITKRQEFRDRNDTGRRDERLRRVYRQMMEVLAS